MSAPSQGAALSNASLQGPYSFVLEKVDDTVAFGPTFTTAQGTIVFDPTGKVSLQGSINRSGTLQSFASSGNFTLASSGDLQLSFTDPLFSVSGTVSFDLNSIAATNAASGTVLSHQIFLAVKQPATSLLPASLNGRYFLAERTITASGSSFQLENSTGTISFDGLGNFSAQLTGSSSAAASSTSGNYQVTPDGTVLLNFSGRGSAIRFGFTADAAIGFGASTQENSKHDLFAITKANNEPIGNTAVNGSYLLADAWFALPSAKNTTPGFSVTANAADYRGDGTVLYQPVQKNAAPVRGTVTVNGDSSVLFSGMPGAAASFGGGVGTLGNSLVAAALNDPTVFHFLVGVRTPSQALSAVNAASFASTAALSPGALISIFGRNLARQTAQASSLPLPTTLGGVTVKIGGVDAPLLFVSPFQVNLQVPYEVQPSNTALTILLDGIESGPLPVAIGAASPGIFTLSSDGNGAGIFLHGSDFSVITRANPARTGEVVLIYATGLGAVLPGVASGAAAPGDPAAAAAASVSVQIGGVDAGTPLFAGLAPGFAGLYQINITVPSGVAAGDVPVVVTAAGVQSKTVTLPVGQ